MTHNIPRFQRLRAFMVLNGIKWEDLANLLGVSKNGCMLCCQRETIKPIHYQRLLELGFPKDVLPLPTVRGKAFLDEASK